MVDSKPTTSWAVVSLVCSILGCLAALALLALAERYGEIARASAGIGIIWGLGHGLLATMFCLMGIAFGVVALLRISHGDYAGRGMTWTAIVLACCPLVFAVFMFLMGNADSNPWR